MQQPGIRTAAIGLLALDICLVFTIGIELLNAFLHGGKQVGTMTLLIKIIGLITCLLFAGLFSGNDRNDVAISAETLIFICF